LISLKQGALLVDYTKISIILSQSLVRDRWDKMERQANVFRNAYLTYNNRTT
jgi:hypothetical protein